MHVNCTQICTYVLTQTHTYIHPHIQPFYYTRSRAAVSTCVGLNRRCLLVWGYVNVWSVRAWGVITWAHMFWWVCEHLSSPCVYLWSIYFYALVLICAIHIHTCVYTHVHTNRACTLIQHTHMPSYMCKWIFCVKLMQMCEWVFVFAKIKWMCTCLRYVCSHLRSTDKHIYVHYRNQYWTYK